MSNEKEITTIGDGENEVESNYQPPLQKTIEEIIAADQEDESLRKYKEALLGAAQSEKIIVDANDPRKVIVKKLALCVPGRDDMELDLSGDVSKLKKQVFTIKEGIHGLKYVQKTYRMAVPVDKMTHMVGSYPPKTEIQSYLTPFEEAPADEYGGSEEASSRKGRFRVTSSSSSGPPETTGRFRLTPQNQFQSTSPCLHRGRFAVIPEEPKGSTASGSSFLIKS